MKHGGLKEIIRSGQAPMGFVRNEEAFFNHGLGCVTKGTKEAERIAKVKGLVPLGNSILKPEQIIKQRKKEETEKVTAILREGMKAARVGRTLEGKPLKIKRKE